MTREISQRELRNDSGAILRAVEEGEDFVVTRNGSPLARLKPLARRRFIRKADLILASRQLPAIDAAAFRRDIDAYMNQDLDA